MDNPKLKLALAIVNLITTAVLSIAIYASAMMLPFVLWKLL